MSIRLLAGDCRDVLATLPANSIHCCVTSPPYYGLRDYGTARWDGGDAACDHKGPPRQSASSTLVGNGHGNGKPLSPQLQAMATPFRATCGKCGAVRVDRQIGVEATPDLYLQTMVAVFREVRRVLRPDGTCWVNIGDSFSSGGNGPGSGKQLTNIGANMPAKRTEGLAPKQLLMMPARLALALQADGWWIRSDIIWAKPNPMPESCRDRPTGAHEHVFLLTKSARYFYDADAVREAYQENSIERARSPVNDMGGPNGEFGARVGQGGKHAMVALNPAGRNLRNVWTLPTHPYAQAHFATFPPALAERCIRAGTSERGCCAACGAPWVRVTETGYIKNPNTWGKSSAGRTVVTGSNNWDGGAYPNLCKQVTTTGWAPSCACGADTVPCTVLDPFAGAGTTLLVADRLQRDAIGIELNPEYLAMTQARIEGDAGLFASVEEAPPQSLDLPSAPPANDKADITLLDYLERETANTDVELCDAR